MRRRRKLGAAIGGALALTGLITGGILTQIGGVDDQIVPPEEAAYRLSLVASRDLGAMPPRGTGAGQWCGAIGGLPAPSHCWELQQTSGDAVDTGSPGGWDLTPQGTPRAGVATGLPVGGGATVDVAGELSAWSEADADRYQTASGVPAVDSTNLVSITFVAAAHAAKTNQYLVYHEASTIGYRVYYNSDGVYALARDGAVLKFIKGGTAPYGGWICATAVLDGRSSNAGRIYLNGVDDTSATNDLGGMGSWQVSALFRLLGFGSSSYYFAGGVARVRRDDVAVTLAQHQALCGTYTQPLRASHRAYADTAWTQSGGARCPPTSATRATCLPGGAAGYRWDASGIDWAAEGQGGANPVLHNLAINCTNWTCQGAAGATPEQIAPDGSPTATQLTSLDATPFVDDVIQNVTFTSGLEHYPRLWAKCASGSFSWQIDTGSDGELTVDCTCVGGQWRLIHKADPCVSSYKAWDPGVGVRTLIFVAGAGEPDPYIWAPTITEAPGWSVIPTGASAVTVGGAAVTVNNASGAYYRASATYFADVETLDGTCLELGSTIRLSGPVAAPAVCSWGSLRIRR